MAKFNLTAQIQLQAPNNVSQVVKQIQGQLKGINVPVQAQKVQKTTQQINQLTQATKNAADSTKKLGSTFETSVRRFSAIAIATRAVSLFTNTLAASIREAIDFERELIKISQVTGKSIQQLEFLSSTVSQLSTNLGVSSTSLIGVSRILSQAGLSASQTTTALKTLAKTELAPTFDNISETAEGAIAIFNQFQAGAAALEAQLGAVNAVAGQFAVEAGDLISVVRRTGGVFKAAGGDLNELIALFTSVRSTTRESAESIATGLRTIFTRIQRPKTIEFLREYGVELLDLEGKFIGPYEAINRLSQALQGLEQGDISFIKIAEELGGFRQIGKVIPLLQQFGVAEEALAVATRGANSLTEDQAKAQQALAVQIMKVKEQFAELVRNVTNTVTFQALAQTMLKLASAFIKIADALAPLIPMLTAFAAIKFTASMGTGIGSLIGGAKMNQGGKVSHKAREVMHFARGGSVPGVGNRDTVPAMLMPGEFVIRKSSVQKLGVNNLKAMNENKYASGGIVDDMRDGSLKVGAAILERDKKAADSALSVTKKDVQPLLPKGTTFTSAVPARFPKVTAVRKGLSEATYKSFDTALNESLVSSVDQAVARLSQDLGIAGKSIPQSEKADFLKGINAASRGNLFEDILLALKGGPFSERETGQNFDFPGGLSGVLSDDYKGLPSRFIDAKASFAAASVSGGKSGSLRSKTIREIADDLKKNAATYLTRQKGSQTDRKEGPQKGQTYTLAQLSRFGVNTAADAKRAGFVSPYRGKYEMKNAGGSISGLGTDTVPAMLTPGEFVVNKQSAQNIGYSQLSKMNKVGKYAKGGVVKGTKMKGFTGGGASGDGSSTNMVALDITPVNAALMTLSKQAFLTTETMTQVISALANFGATVNGVTQVNVKNLVSSGAMTKAQAKNIINTIKSDQQLLKNIKTRAKEDMQVARTTRALQLLGDEADQAKKSIADKSKEDDKDTADTTGGMGPMMKFNMGMMAATTALSMFAPTLDESSGYLDHLLNNVSEVGIQLSSMAMLLGNFGEMFSGVGKSINSFGDSLYGAGKASKANAAANAQNTATEAAESQSNVVAKATEDAESQSNTRNAMQGSSGGGGGGGAAKASMTLSGGLMAAATATAVVAASFYALYQAQADYQEQLLQSAVKEGDEEGASDAAEKKIRAERTRNFATAGAVGGGAIGAAAGAFLGPLGIAIGALIGSLAGGIAAAAYATFYGPSEIAIQSAKARAVADAAAASAAEALAEQSKSVSEAMELFNSGDASVFDVLAASEAAMVATLNARQKAEAAQAAGLRESTKYLSSWGAAVRDFFAGLGIATSSSDIAKEATDEDQKAVDDAKKQQAEAAANNKGLKILQKQVAASGGSFEDFMAMLQAQAPETAKALMSNKDVMRGMRDGFVNIKKESDRTRKAFDAMNLGMHGVNAAAAAVTVGLDGFLARQEKGNIGLATSIKELEAGVTSAAMGMNPDVFSSALNDAASVLKDFGASGDQVDKFKGNMEAINQAQVSFAASSQEAKDRMVADFNKGAQGKNSLQGKKEVLAEAVVMNLGPDVPKEVKDRITAAIEGGKLTQADMKQIMDGNFAPLSKALGELGKAQLEQVMPALKAEADARKKLTAVQQKLLAAEQAYIDARKRSIDVELEAANIIQEFGGPAVTNAQKESAILGKANLDGEGLGVGNLRDGSAASISQRNSNIQNELNRISKIEADAVRGDPSAIAAMDGEAGKRLANTQDRLNKLAQQNYETTKQLIDLKRQELKVISARNKAEKDAMKSLMAGDIEAFLDQQAAIGAGAAIAVGDTGLAQSFGSSAIGGAFANFEQMAADGVQDYFGRSIQGAGGLMERTGMAAGFGRSSAQVLAGSTPEEERLKAEARALAETLPQTANILESQAAQGVQAALDQKTAAEKQLAAAKERTRKNMAAMPAPSKPKDKEFGPEKPTKDAFGQPIEKGPTAGSDGSVTSSGEKLGEIPPINSSSIPNQNPNTGAILPSQIPNSLSNIPPTGANNLLSADQRGEETKTASEASGSEPTQQFDGSLITSLTAAINNNTAGIKTLNSSINTLSNSSFRLQGAEMFDGAVNNFGNHVNTLSNSINSLSNMSLNVTLGNSNVTVSITEPRFLTELTANIKKDILNQVMEKLNTLKPTSDGVEPATGSNPITPA